MDNHNIAHQCKDEKYLKPTSWKGDSDAGELTSGCQVCIVCRLSIKMYLTSIITTCILTSQALQWYKHTQVMLGCTHKHLKLTIRQKKHDWPLILRHWSDQELVSCSLHGLSRPVSEKGTRPPFGLQDKLHFEGLLGITYSSIDHEIKIMEWSQEVTTCRGKMFYHC